MVFDWHDECPEWSAMPWLLKLKEIRPDFKATLFAIPGRGSASHWLSYPSWAQIVPHGWSHPDPHECEYWGVARMRALLDEPIVKECFPTRGWCSPGWLVSDGTYAALGERGYWIMDHPKNNDRRPPSLPCFLLGSPGSWHGHTHDVEGNGIAESFAEVERLVREAESFQFVSEVVK